LAHKDWAGTLGLCPGGGGSRSRVGEEKFGREFEEREQSNKTFSFTGQEDRRGMSRSGKRGCECLRKEGNEAAKELQMKKGDDKTRPGRQLGTMTYSYLEKKRRKPRLV